MKKLHITCIYTFVTMTVLAFGSCVHETKNTDTETSHPAPTPIEEDKSATTEQKPIWEYDFHTDSLVRIDSASFDLTAEDAIQVMNNMYRDVALESVRQSGDTLFVKIDTATALTQQMGSAGARAYMSLATFTLTEVKGIHAVSFDFKEGDHASPGVYKRASFEKK